MTLDWMESCAKCQDGEIEPKEGEYYGEPNGCNSPTYGEHPPVGNAAAMREALVLALDALISWLNGTIDRTANRETIKAIRAALSAPPRQCDVGTATEQAERFVKHCQSFLNRDGIKACVGCPCCGVVMYGKCELAWAQTPYAAEGADK